MILNDEGKLEITLSQLFKDQLAEIVSGIPSCPLKVRRDWDPRKHQHVETRAVDASCLRRRIGKMVQRLSQRPEVNRSVMALSDEIASVSSHDVTALAQSGRMVSFTEQNMVTDVLQSAEAEAKLLEDFDLLANLSSGWMGVLSSLAVFVSTATILEDLWKLRADPQPPMPFYKVEDDSCPKRQLACAGTRCQGEHGKCTAEWKGCACVISGRGVADSFYFGNEWNGVADEVQKFVFGSDPDPTQSIPQPSCTSSSGEDRNLANVESDVWSRYVFPNPSLLDFFLI